LITAGELAERIGAEVEGDPGRRIAALRPPEAAGPGDLAYLADGKRAPSTFGAGVILVGRDRARDGLPESATLLRHPHAHLGFARAIGILHPEPPPPWTGIDPSATVHESARIGEGAIVGPRAVIGPDVVLGRDVRVDAGTVIVARCRIGDGAHLHANVTLYPGTRIGPGSIIHSGAVIGADGFGFVPTPTGAVKIPHIGGVEIGAQVEIGANTTVDRGVLGDTVVQDGAKIDNLCQIAHNCVIGRGTVLAAQVGIAGSAKIGSGVQIGGQVGAAGHITIGDRARIAAQSGVCNDVAEGEEVMGFPATDSRIARRAYVLLFQLPELRRHIEQLARRIEAAIPAEERED